MVVRAAFCRSRAIAGAITKADAGLSAIILTGSPVAGRFTFPEHVDHIRLPGVTKLVYGLKSVYDPTKGLNLPRSVRDRMHWTGYLRREIGTGAITIPEPYILITPGGGGDGEAMVNLVLSAYEQDPDLSPMAVLVYGPFLSETFIALEKFRPEGQRLAKLHPFLAQSTLPAAAPLSGNTILSVAMMRPGDKLASYQIIADALPRLKAPDWQLHIAGDGPARADVEALFAPLAPRVTFLGQLDQAALAAAYQDACTFLWPGVNEAFGMVYLEAQAAGVPVVAQNRPGVRDVVTAGGLCAPDLGAAAIAHAIDAVLLSEDLRKSRAQIGRAHIANSHLLGTATKTLWDHIRPQIHPA